MRAFTSTFIILTGAFASLGSFQAAFVHAASPAPSTGTGTGLPELRDPGVLNSLVGNFLAGRKDNKGVHGAAKAMRSERNFLHPLDLDPAQVQKTMEDGNWETGWNSSTVPENVRGNKSVVLAAIKSGVIESWQEIPAELWAGGRSADADVVSAAIRKGLLKELYPAQSLFLARPVGDFDWSAKVLAAAIDEGLWTGRFTDIPPAFRQVPTASGEVVAAAIRSQPADPRKLFAVLRQEIVRGPEEISDQLLLSSPEALAAAIHRWWSEDGEKTFLDIPRQFREGDTASGAVIGAAIAKNLRGAPANLAAVRSLYRDPHVHAHDEVTLAGLSRSPSWFPTWEALPETAKGSPRVVREVVETGGRGMFDALLADGNAIRWGNLVRMPARTDVSVLAAALTYAPPELFLDWEFDVPYTAKRNVDCLTSAMRSGIVLDELRRRGLFQRPDANGRGDVGTASAAAIDPRDERGSFLPTVAGALQIPLPLVMRSARFVTTAIECNLLTRWAEVPDALRTDVSIVETIVEKMEDLGGLAWWWLEDGIRGAFFTDFEFFRDVGVGARSNPHLVASAIEAFGRSTLAAWAENAGTGVSANGVDGRVRELLASNAVQNLQVLEQMGEAEAEPMVRAVVGIPNYLLRGEFPAMNSRLLEDTIARVRARHSERLAAVVAAQS